MVVVVAVDGERDGLKYGSVLRDDDDAYVGPGVVLDS
jgi:hypothetical protein